MESQRLLHADEPETPHVSAARSSRVAVVVLIACSMLGVVAAIARSSLRMTPATSASALPPAELYRKKLIYGPDYGTLLGDDVLQKAWPGLTCDRSDDDKWGWAEDAMAQPLDSGTNCVWGDTWFCMHHHIKNTGEVKKYHGLMEEVSELLWNRCNNSCNATDERNIAVAGVDAHLVGSSSLAACQFQGVADMKEVCTGVPDKFKIESRRRYLAVSETPVEDRRLMNNNPPSVKHRNATNLLINNTYNQEGCNTHALCGMCVDSNGTVDSYCHAFLYYYDMTFMSTYDASLFWYNVHFWCLDEVLDAIEDGTFIDKVEGGEIPKADEIYVATSNHEAMEYFGSWHIPTDDAYISDDDNDDIV